MSMLGHEIAAWAAKLDDAEISGRQIKQISAQHPDMSIKDAYAIQSAWMDIKFSRGHSRIGRKIGLTSRAMQRAVNITEPDYGVLLDHMLFESGVEIPFDKFIVPRIEVELAFILKRTLSGENVNFLDVLAATDYVVPAVEIIDARIERSDPATGRARNVMDTISDNAANCGLILGGNPVRPDTIDLRWVSALLLRNEVIEDSGVSASVLNHPAQGLAWLARKLAPYGQSLDAGEIILAGSFTSPVDIRQRDVFFVDFGPMGSISTRFV